MIVTNNVNQVVAIHRAQIRYLTDSVNDINNTLTLITGVQLIICVAIIVIYRKLKRLSPAVSPKEPEKIS